VAAQIGWAAAALAVFAVFLSRRRRIVWLAVPIVVASPALALAGDRDAALAGFLAVGITVAGALVFGRHWWAPLAFIAALVLLVLLFAPDAYLAFGLLFLAIIVAGLLLDGTVGLGGPLTPPDSGSTRRRAA
jgi:hypothetical protein